MKFKFLCFCVVAAMALGSHALAAEGRTPIYLSGTVVTAGGRYIVTQNLTGTGATPVIEVAAGNEGADIDLNGFQLSNGTGPAAVILISGSNNVIHGGQLVGGGIGVDFPAGGGNTTIEDVRIIGSIGDGIHCLGGANHTLRRVSVLNSGGYGINLDNAGSVRIETSFIRYTGVDGIRMHSSGRSGVIGTTVSNTVGRGISIDANSYSALVRDSFVQDNQLESIYISANLGAEIWNNVVGGSWLDCIRVTSTARDVSIRENHLTGCGHQPPFVGDGIRIEGAFCSIERNQISSNNDWGLHFSATASQNTYGGNSAMGNQGGAACAGTAYGTEFCDDAAATTNASFGNNLIPTLH